MQRFGQAINHIAGFVNLTALDRRLPAKGRADHLGQCLRAVDNEQSADLGIEPSFEQVIEIQSQYAKKAYDTYTAELSKLGEMYAGLTRNAYKPVEQAAAKAGSPYRRSA
jgi:hypothetical protein